MFVKIEKLKKGLSAVNAENYLRDLMKNREEQGINNRNGYKKHKRNKYGNRNTK